MDMLKICVIFTFITSLQILGKFNVVHACSSVCTCTTIPPKSSDGSSDKPGADDDDAELPQTPRGKKVNCSNNPYPISSIEDINRATTIPLDTIKLDLSKNAISVIHKGSFNRLSDLQRLDLSSNQIVMIEPGAFEGLHNLRRLNLSSNKLGSINSSMFSGLQSLQRLMLSDNKLNTIPEGTFNDLPSLRKIDFKSDYLRCDCHLQWIVKWAEDKKVKISASTKCAVQKELNGTSLKKLEQKDLHCNRPLQLKLFEIMPGRSQIVFEGDKLPLECHAKIVDKQFQMFWLREGAVVQTNRSAGVFVLTRRSPDNTIMIHSLVLENLKSPHRGIWLCMVSTPQGNVTKSVNIVVIDSDAVYCKEVTTKTNKGVYMWKATVAGVTKSQPCRMGKGVVTYDCDKSGHWHNLNRTSCDFTNELTRRLQGLASKVNVNSSKIISDAKTLERIVSAQEGSLDWFTTVNPEYVDLASLVIYRLSRHVAAAEDIVSSVLYSASRVMNISASILFDAQRQRKSCSRIVRAIEEIPKQVKGKKQYSQSSDLIVMESRSFARQHFPGVQCGRLDLQLDKTIHRMVHNNQGYVFVCSSPAKNDSNLSFMNLKQLTSVTVPKSTITVEVSNTTSDDNADANRDVTFQFIWYKNSNLFPVVIDQHLDPVLRGKKWNVISSVISVSFSEPVTNLTEPVELSFEIPETDKRVVPVYWDVGANGGFGDWRTDGCSIVEKWSTLVTVHCYRLMPIAIMEDQSSVRVSMFHMMEAVVYIGSCICLLCLMAVIITYVSCYRFLNVPKKMKHSVINICISSLLLIIGFTMGVRRTDHILACQIVGIGLHYLTLVALFWFTVTASNMLKKFRKAEKPPPPPVDLPMPLPPKPMIRFYLLAWGVPSIISGITAAVSFEFYDTPTYCFLEWDPGLGALVGPAGFLLLLNLFFLLRISCVIRGSTGVLNSLDDTQELHITDIELTPSDSRIETRRPSINSNSSSKSSVSSVMDFERRPITQLRALVAILLIFLVMWLTAAFAVAKPFKSVIPYQELVFSYMYGVFSAVFGLFMLIYYCLGRKDSQSSWKRFFLCESNNMYDTNQGVPNEMPHSNGHVTTGSGSDISNSNKVGSTTVILNHVNHVKNTEDELSNLNLVPSKPPSEMDESVNTSVTRENMANSFYNPRQNAVATKFWEKKNKHNSKLFTKDMAKNMSIGSGDESNISDRPPRPTQGYLSDGSHANSNHGNMLNIDMQLQNNESVAERQVAKSPTSPGLPPSYSSVITSSANNIPLYPMSQARLGSPHGGLMAVARITSPFTHPMLPSRVASPLTRPMSPGRVASPLTRAISPECVVTTGRVMTPVGSGQNCSIVSYASAPPIPQHISSPSESLNHFSAFAVVPPRHNNSLPRAGKPVSAPSSPEREFPVSELNSVEPGSVPRLGDFDGQSQVSSVYSHERQRSPLPSDLQYMSQSGYSSPPDGYTSSGPVFKQYGLIDGQPANGAYKLPPQQQPHRNRTNSGGYSSDNSRHRRKLENSFVQQVEQRIPQGVYANHVGKPPRPPISPVSDSDNNSRLISPDSDSQLHCKKYRLNDSDHNSEPASKSSRKHSDHNKHSKIKNRGLKKQRSLDWDEEFKNRPPKNVVPYAYVNHNYTDRVMQKLTNKAVNDHLSPKSKAFWMPRSSSSYSEIVQGENVHLCEDSSTSSSDDDDSLDNIWVRRNSRKEKNKKETSV